MQLQNVLYFLVWAGLIFVMMRFGCGAHVTGHGHHPGSHAGDPVKSPEKAVDPVCGMTISARTAKTSVHAGHVYYFCSAECRSKFEASPATYVVPAKSSEDHRHG